MLIGVLGRFVATGDSGMIAVVGGISCEILASAAVNGFANLDGLSRGGMAKA